MDLKDFALSLKKELEDGFSSETARRVGAKINNAKHSNGSPLTSEEKQHILNYIRFPAYNHEDGTFVSLESDNSEFMKLVDIVGKTIGVE